MDDFKERIKKHQKYLREESLAELSKNSSIINKFIKFCEFKNIKLKKDNFQYIQSIGIIANFPNLVYLLNNKVVVDKENLVDFNLLESEFERKQHISGYLYSQNYLIMAHPYFRRGYHSNSNFSPNFIDTFWNYTDKNNDVYIALDFDRVRINVDTRMYMEFDTWYGAKFTEDISIIEDGVIKLTPPLDLESSDIEFFFGNTFSLDIKWASTNGIKTFQAEEFKMDNLTTYIKGKKYFPVKYLHAEYDNNEGYFRHFDGAIHFYTEDEYYERRKSDFNYSSKNDLPLKADSKKLFKINGRLKPEVWTKWISHYLSGNPLVFEYFEGKIPDDIIEIVDNLRKDRQKDN